MSLYGFNEGYSLSSSYLSDWPSIDAAPLARNASVSPNILSLNSPTANVAKVQLALTAAGGAGPAHLPSMNMMTAPPPLPMSAARCKNVGLTSAQQASAGAAQCIDRDGNCQPPINMRCPVGSVFLDQFTGAGGTTSVLTSIPFTSK